MSGRRSYHGTGQTMIHHFEPPSPLEPEDKELQWIPAIAAGLIAGLILLLVPGGSPWTSFTFFSRVIMGRIVPDGSSMPLPGAMMLHLDVSLVYGLVISLAVVRLRQWRAIVAGGVTALLLFLINFGVVSIWFPELAGNEPMVFLTHLVFGLLAAAAYRGLLRRRPVSPPVLPNSN